MCQVDSVAINNNDSDNLKMYLKSGRRQIGEHWRETEGDEGWIRSEYTECIYTHIHFSNNKYKPYIHTKESGHRIQTDVLHKRHSSGQKGFGKLLDFISHREMQLKPTVRFTLLQSKRLLCVRYVREDAIKGKLSLLVGM